MAEFLARIDLQTIPMKTRIKLEKDQITGLSEAFNAMKTWKGKGMRGACLCGTDCGNPIKSHLISECILRLIAENGHVISLAPPNITDIKAAHPKLPEMKALLKGCLEASVFRGFCDHHDNEIFRKIDSTSIACDNESLSLIAFRALGENLLTKYQVCGQMLETMNKREAPEFFIARFVQEMNRFTEVYLIFCQLKKDIESREFKHLKHFVVNSSISSFAACGSFVPYLDAKCRPLKRGKAWSVVSILPQESCGLAVFSWPRSNAVSCDRLIDSIKKISDTQLGDWFLKFSLEHVEQIYFSPVKWAMFSEGQKTMLLERFSKSLAAMNDQANYKVPRNHFDVLGKSLDPWVIKSRSVIE